MRKTGFSLVELSIVILVIGALMLMITKGRHLVESVRMKKDMSTIMRLQNALHEYYALYGTTLEMNLIDGGSYKVARMDMDQFVVSGLLKPSDYYSPISKQDWGIYYCNPMSYLNNGIFSPGLGFNIIPPEQFWDNSSICVGIDRYSGKMSTRLACNIENMMDSPVLDGLNPNMGLDQDDAIAYVMWTGSGRVGTGVPLGAPVITPDQYRDCNLVATKDRVDYFYLITPLDWRDKHETGSNPTE